MAVHTPEPPLQPEPPEDYKQAKASAKAAKAYAKAQRPWYKRKRYILSLGAILLVVIVAASSSGSSNQANTAPAPANASSAAAEQPSGGNAQEAETQTAPAATGPTAKLPIQNGDWRLDSVTVKDDGLGSFGGRARITYTGDNPEGGTNLFTLTVFSHGKDVAALTGSADSVKHGTAATVEFVSTDDFVGGPYKYDFQNDL
jgi:hypothetical protein